MEALGLILQTVVIVGFLLYAYSKIKGQSVRDTLEEIKEFIESFKNE